MKNGEAVCAVDHPVHEDEIAHGVYTALLASAGAIGRTRKNKRSSRTDSSVRSPS